MRSCPDTDIDPKSVAKSTFDVDICELFGSKMNKLKSVTATFEVL